MRMKKNSTVLQDHKKNGKIFIPPLIHKLGKIQTTSYLKQLLPQLIWWDVLEWKTSTETTLSIAESLASFFREISDNSHWWGFVSNYESLNEILSRDLREHLTNKGVLEPFENSLHDFLLLFPLCPLRKILPTDSSDFYDPSFLESFKIRMVNLFDRCSVNAISMQSKVIWMGFLLERLKVKEDLILSDFPEILKYPTTPKSIQLASSVRAILNSIGSLQLSPYRQDQWTTYFWKRGEELDPINFSYLERT